MVVVSHASTMMGKPENFGAVPYPVHMWGGFGVAIFFVISGFIIAYVTLDSDLRPKIGIGEYAWRRFVRIMPFVWLCVIGYNLLSFVGTHQIEWGPALRAMVLSPVGELKPNVLWSLRHEWLFYGLFALAMMGIRPRPAALFIWFAAPLLYASLLAATGGQALPSNPWLRDLAWTVLMGGNNGANLQFAAGFALGVLHVRGAPFTRARLRGGLWLCILLCVGFAALIEITVSPLGEIPVVTWATVGELVGYTALAAVIVWTGLVTLPSNDLLERIGIRLGDASFSIYLVHNPVILILFEVTKKTGLAEGRVPIALLYAVYVAAAIAVGIVVHKLVEKPVIAWATRLRPGRREKAVAA